MQRRGPQNHFRFQSLLLDLESTYNRGGGGGVGGRRVQNIEPKESYQGNNVKEIFLTGL